MVYLCDIALFALLTLLLNEVTAAKLENELKERLKINNDDYIDREKQRNELPPSVREIVSGAHKYNESERRAYGLAVRWGDSDAADDLSSDDDTFNAMTYTPAMRAYTATDAHLSHVARPPDPSNQKHHGHKEDRLQKVKQNKFEDHNRNILKDIMNINKLYDLTSSSTYYPMPKATEKHFQKDIGDLIGNSIKSGDKRQINSNDRSIQEPTRNLQINRHANAPAPQPFEVLSYKNLKQILPHSQSPRNMEYVDPLMYTKGRLLDKGEFFGVRTGRKYAAQIRDIHGSHDKLPRERVKSTTRDPRDFDLAPAKGERANALRSKGRICQRNVLIPEGPKYDSKGMVYLKAFKPKKGSNMDYARTVKPDFILPKCCNCCKKSVLGCE